jgi:putative flippase GtrA
MERAMTDETVAVRLPWHVRLWSFVTHPSSWRQVARFLCVGAVGYVVNLAVYAGCVHVATVEYRASAVAAFMCALATTFVLNRHYTFEAATGSVGTQAWRYLLVNLLGFATNLFVLQVLVERAAMAKVPSEAIAAVVAAPVNFAGQRLWAFARPAAT